MTKSNVSINVSVTFRHTEPTEALKNAAIEKLTLCVKKYVSYDADVRAVLCVEKRDHVVEVHVHSKGFDASAKASTDDLYSAIDKVVDNLHAQLRKQKERAVQRSSKVAQVSRQLAT